MAGLLDWLTDGALGGGMPPMQQTGSDVLPPASTPLSFQRPEFANPPPPPVDPAASGSPAPPSAASMPPPDPSSAGSSTPPTMATPPEPPVPMPQPRPAGADAGPGLPPPPPPQPPGQPTSLAPPALTPQDASSAYSSYQAAGGGGPVTPVGGGIIPDQQGRGGILSKALGMSPDQSNQLAAKLGAGFTAAGNSAGKSPFQAFSSGAGAALDGGSKEMHQNTKEAQGYLDKALAAKKAGDDATYKTNYMQYLAADLKASQDKAASKDAANKNDSPTQLFLAAQRNVASDPLVKGAFSALQNAQKTGSPQEVAAAQAAYEKVVNERQAAHLAGVGLHPRTAQELAKQPGMTKENPLDAGAAGITKENIGQKLQPGQYYKNPTDGQIYQFNGSPTGSTSSATPAVKPKGMAPSTNGRKMASTAPDDEDD